MSTERTMLLRFAAVGHEVVWEGGGRGGGVGRGFGDGGGGGDCF